MTPCTCKAFHSATGRRVVIEKCEKCREAE
jgi:hypothetical protein